MPETVNASPRKDKDTGRWGLWVDDFEGAQAGARVPVTVRTASGGTWEANAELVRQVRGSDGDLRWIAENAREASQPADEGHPQAGSRSLAAIVQEALELSGWVLREIETEYVNGEWHVRIRQEVEPECPATETSNTVVDSEPF